MKILKLFLTCKDDIEADAISHALLEKRLIACANKVAVSSSFCWNSAVDTANEVLLIMQTVEIKFTEIEAEIKKLHSYQTFVLTGFEVVRSSQGVMDWIKDSIV